MPKQTRKQILRKKGPVVKICVPHELTEAELNRTGFVPFPLHPILSTYGDALWFEQLRAASTKFYRGILALPKSPLSFPRNPNE